jgi:hypothetical protein
VTAGGVLAGIVFWSARFTRSLAADVQASFCAVIVVHAIVFVVLGFIEFPR